MAHYVNGDFSYPREQAGSGVRSFSQFTTADFILQRFYVQEKNAYRPLPISSRDYQYKSAYLVEEVETKRDGYLVYFTRTYATVPNSRSEYQEMLFTFPGRSALLTDIGPNGTLVTRWDRYGAQRPSTVWREARVDHTYSLGRPSTSVPTQIEFEGQPVDFTGSVYSDDGSRFFGNTNPSGAPSSYIISDVAQRWRGDIWERTRISVSLSSGGGGSFSLL